MSETTTPTTDTNESSIFNDIIDSVLIFLGMADEGVVVGAKHVRYFGILTLIVGWIGGIWRKTSKPSVNFLGY